jgi:hypothetical protein
MHLHILNVIKVINPQGQKTEKGIAIDGRINTFLEERSRETSVSFLSGL